MSIVQGDNGLTFPFTVDQTKVSDLTNSTVEVAVQRREEILTKTATIIDVSSGLCEFTLYSSDLTLPGVYKYQWTVTFSDGRVFSGDATSFTVKQKLTDTSSSGDITVIVDGGNLG